MSRCWTVPLRRRQNCCGLKSHRLFLSPQKHRNELRKCPLPKPFQQPMSPSLNPHLLQSWRRSRIPGSRALDRSPLPLQTPPANSAPLTNPVRRICQHFREASSDREPGWKSTQHSPSVQRWLQLPPRRCRFRQRNCLCLLLWPRIPPQFRCRLPWRTMCGLKNPPHLSCQNRSLPELAPEQRRRQPSLIEP